MGWLICQIRGHDDTPVRLQGRIKPRCNRCLGYQGMRRGWRI